MVDAVVETRTGHRHRSRGFTMVEVLVVCIVLGVIAGIAVPQYLTHRKKARLSAAISDVRNTGSMIEGAFAKDRAYPASLDAAGSQVEEIKLSDGNEVAQYATINGGSAFRVCVVHRTGGTVDAYALYDSTQGGLSGKGYGAGPAECTPTAAPGPVGPTPTPPAPTGTAGPTGGPGPVDGGGVAGPQNVIVNSDPGATTAEVFWDPVDDATEYAIYLDGATTPAWTGSDPHGDLTGISPGEHDVTVDAKVDGEKTDKSDPATFTIYGDNNFIANAHPISVAAPGATWTTRDYTNADATTEGGEPGSKSLWWTLTAPRDATYTVEVIAPLSGNKPTQPTVRVWKSNATSVGDLGTSLTNNYDSVAFDGAAGDTYKVQITDSCGCTNWNGPFRLRVTPGPSNDHLSQAMDITGLSPAVPWYSPDVDNTYAGTQAGESGRRSTWWTLTVPRDSTYTFRSVAPTSGPALNQAQIRVWKSTTSNVTALGAPLVDVLDGNAALHADTGDTLKIQVIDPCGCNGYFGPFRLLVSPGPANDDLARAETIPDVGAGTQWFSPDTNNTYAGLETGESGRSSVWWTFTPTRSGNYQFHPVGPSTGGGGPQMPRVSYWQTASTNVSALGAFDREDWDGVAINAVAGQTYKIRVTDACGCSGWNGPMRMRVTG